MLQVDIAIVGGGMVGLAAAVALAKNSELKIAVVERGQGAHLLSDETGIRVSAINHRSMSMLKELGVWSTLPSERVAYYSDMHVWDKDNLGNIHFSANDVHQQHIGAIVENDVLRYGLWQQAEACNNITLLENTQITEINYGDTEAFIQVESGTPIMAKLVVAADGAMSKLRDNANIPLTFWDYDQHAIIANIDTADVHNSCARQVFLSTGPLALLPMKDTNQCSIVWSTSPQQAESLMALDDDGFSRALTAASDGVLGLAKINSARQSFPLRMRYARHFVQNNLVLVGDAAHTIHPLAGQGVNLGFGDVQELASAILTGVEMNKPVNDAQSLRQYERARKAAAADMVATMEGFKRLFNGSNPVLRAIRGVGLNVFDTITPLKNWCVKQAL